MAKPVVTKAPRQSIFNTMAIIKAVEKVEKTEAKARASSSDGSLKEISEDRFDMCTLLRTLA